MREFVDQSTSASLANGITIAYLVAAAMDPEQIWREKSDEDVVEAGERLFEYTADGERIIRAELRRRGLPDPAAPVDYCWKCGRGIYARASADVCEHCGEALEEAVRVRLTEPDQPLNTEIVYRSRFAHEVELVIAELENEGIVVARGHRGFGADISLRYFETPALERTEYTVLVAAADAPRAREIIESLPVSRSDDDETPPAPPFDDP